MGSWSPMLESRPSFGPHAWTWMRIFPRGEGEEYCQEAPAEGFPPVLYGDSVMMSPTREERVAPWHCGHPRERVKASSHHGLLEDYVYGMVVEPGWGAWHEGAVKSHDAITLRHEMHGFVRIDKTGLYCSGEGGGGGAVFTVHKFHDVGDFERQG